MTPAEPRATRVSVVWAALALVLILGAIWRGSHAVEPSPTVRDCRRAVAVDGVLRCDGPPTLAALCGARVEPDASTPLRPGDAVSRAALCELWSKGQVVARGDPGWGRMDGDDLVALSTPVNVNEAAAEELESLPGIGPVLAQRILESRPFADVDALIDVRGIGPKKLAALRSRAVVTW